MATIALYAGKINQMPNLIKAAKNSVETFKSELSSLQKKASKVDSGVCDLSEVISSIQASTQTQENRIEALENFQTKSENFINDTVSIDNKVAETVNQNKEDFYDKYDYLKPDCEKSGWEKFCDACKAVGEWCKEHWKLIVAAIIIVIAVVLICTGVGGILGAIALGVIKGAVSGALIGGLTSIMNGESFWKGFENGLFSGAIMGGVFGGLGKAAQLLGSSCKFLYNTGAGQFLCQHFGDLVKIAKYSSLLSLSMFGFDMLSLGAGLVFGKDNWLTSLNQRLHQSAAYNVFQFSVSTLAVISGGLVKGMQNPSCFIAGTLILTANGMVAIEKIKAGDKVISADPDTGRGEQKTVIETFHRTVTELVHLTIDGERITTTHNHPFYVFGKGFVNAGKLQVSDILCDSNHNTLSIDNIVFETAEQGVDVFNFLVQDYHTYFVGTHEILVHNANCLPKQDYLKRVEENGDRVYEREINGERINGKVEVKYTKGPDGKYRARFEPYTHPDYKTPIKANFEGGRQMNGNQAHDAYWMNKQVFGSPDAAPEGWTWHHCEDGVSMILVDSDVHGAFYHEGGASVIRGNLGN